MSRTALAIALAAFAALFVLEGCGGAGLQTLSIVNKSPRPIAEVYVFPTGAADHGASRGTVAPDATLAVKVKAGNVDVLAVSAKLRVDDKQSETRTATQTVEVKHPLSLVFYDSTQMVPGLDAANTIGVPFQVTPEPAPEPAPAR